MAPNTAHSTTVPQAGALEHDETQLWKDLSVDSWKNSVMSKDSVFYDLYIDTRRRVIDACEKHSYDVVVEVGCGTGEVIGHLDELKTPRIGVDINPDFIQHCQGAYKDSNTSKVEFFVADAMKLDEWWVSMGFDKKYKAPLMVCPNNTIMIMPEEIRDTVIEQMRVVAGIEGRIVITYWNGRMFAHGVMGYYRKNSDLCGTFDLTEDHVDWEAKKIETRTSYKSEWPTAEDVSRWMASLLIDVEIAEPEQQDTLEVDHIAEVGMGVYLWLKGISPQDSSMGSARDYYDDKDSQTFYRTIWGENNVHIGRHDLIAADPSLANADLRTKIQKAQEIQEEKFMDVIKGYYGEAKVRCLDMGCGFGGLLRNMDKNGMIWSAVGVDISGEMIDAATRLSKGNDSLTFYRESYMNTSVSEDGMDLCISTEAFLHVGPGNHEAVLREAWRVLRPGGRLIFTDIVGLPNAPEEAKVLYERIGLQSFQTIEGYFSVAKEMGFGELAFEEHSSNISVHYGTVLEALEEMWSKNEINIKESSKNRMVDGLTKWRDLADSCLQWGIISMRKLDETPLSRTPSLSVFERSPSM
jgi:sarcosine/dimethylglycine N-methyltransferase